MSQYSPQTHRIYCNIRFREQYAICNILHMYTYCNILPIYCSRNMQFPTSDANNLLAISEHTSTLFLSSILRPSQHYYVCSFVRPFVTLLSKKLKQTCTSPIKRTIRKIRRLTSADLWASSNCGVCRRLKQMPCCYIYYYYYHI